MALEIDSVTPPSSTSTVSRPSPAESCFGNSNFTSAPPSALLVTFTRGSSAPSTVITAESALPASASPVGRRTSTVALTVSPAP